MGRARGGEGFAPAAALRVAAALPRAFPGVFKGGALPLAELWADRYVPFEDEKQDDSESEGRRHEVAVRALRAGVSCVLLVVGPDASDDGSATTSMAWSGSNRLIVMADDFWARGRGAKEVEDGGLADEFWPSEQKEGGPVATVASRGAFKDWTATLTLLYGERPEEED